MEYLSELYLRGLSLHTLPKNISQLKKLKVLDLEDNLFTEISIEISCLNNLIKLNMKKNKLSQLTNINLLSHLEILNLRDNLLNPLDLYPIGSLKSIIQLDISKNQLNISSKEIELSSGKEILFGNIYNCLTIQKLRFGKKWISGSLLCEFIENQRNLSKDVIEFAYLSNLKIIGPSNVGKSSFIKWITSRFISNGSKLSNVQYEFMAPTRGVDIIQKHISFDNNNNNNNNLKNNDLQNQISLSTGSRGFLSIWDFGGDIKFRPMQEQFLNNNNGIYILMFNWKKRNHEFDDIISWLNLIKAHSKKLPVILVGTYDELSSNEYSKIIHTDKNYFMQKLYKYYESIEDIFIIHVSVKSLSKASQAPIIFNSLEKIKSDKYEPPRQSTSQLLEFENYLREKMNCNFTSRNLMNFHNIFLSECKKKKIPLVSFFKKKKKK